MPQQQIPRILLVFVMVFISLLLPNSIWKRRNANGIWKAFQKWAQRSGFKLEKRQPTWNVPDAPTATGKINNVKVEIIVSPQHKQHSYFASPDYHTVVRVYAETKTELDFSISLATLADSVAKKVGIENFKTGNEDFDRNFDVDSNDEELMQCVLDELTLENLVSNQFLFQFGGLKFRQNYLRYERKSAPSTAEEVQEYYAIAEFMAGIVGKIDQYNRTQFRS